MHSTKRVIERMSHCRGSARYSSSTASLATAVCEKSYSRLLSRICTGAIGRNGRIRLAPSTLNMLPKLELAVILMYLRMLPNTLRPSSTPSSSTRRFLSSRMMSADSLAMSTAVSTEMPTSAARSAGPSLMPSPRKPTTWPPRCSASTTRTFCCGLSRANTWVSRTAAVSASSPSWSISGPTSRRCTSKPTWRHTLRVTVSLSPVSTFTAMPFACSAVIASATLSLGGSRKARNPISVSADSSAIE